MFQAKAPVAAFTAAVKAGHLVVCFLSVAGAYVVPVKYLPFCVMIAACIVMRHHDYCWLTKLQEALEYADKDCKPPPSELKGPFMMSVLRDTFGLDPAELDDMLFGLGQIMLGLGFVVAMYRVAARAGISMLPNNFLMHVVLFAVVLWVATEAYLVTRYNARPFCEVEAEASA